MATTTSAPSITDRNMTIAINGASLAAYKLADHHSHLASIELINHIRGSASALPHAIEDALAAEAASLEALVHGREFVAIQEGKAS